AGYLAPSGQPMPQAEAREDVELPDVKLEPAAALTGVIVDAAGKPVAGAKACVLLEQRHPAFDSSVVPTSDAQGRFTMTGLDPTDTVPLRARTDRAVTDGAVVV